MKTENYIIKLKNGDSMEINKEQYIKISDLLTKPRAEIPNFIKIDGEIIRTDSISTIRKQSW
jgi:hypothetical protein